MFDLLAPPGSEALEVRCGSDGDVSLPFLTHLPITSTSDIDAMLHAGASRRHTHATLMNATSSRSHMVLTLYVTLANVTDGVRVQGKLHLVDLAGSERVGKSGVSGEQLREAQHINKSLSALEQANRTVHPSSPTSHSWVLSPRFPHVHSLPASLP